MIKTETVNNLKLNAVLLYKKKEEQCLYISFSTMCSPTKVLKMLPYVK